MTAYHNQRFEKIWEVLARWVNFDGEYLIDVGCGHGDLIRAANDAGAKVLGIDRDPQLIEDLQPEQHIRENFKVEQWDIENVSSVFWNSLRCDIITCMSVLPYLYAPWITVARFASIAPAVVLEIQYAGDGPGLSYLTDDQTCAVYLLKYFHKVYKIGATLVQGRNAARTIWFCESEPSTSEREDTIRVRFNLQDKSESSIMLPTGAALTRGVSYEG